MATFPEQDVLNVKEQIAPVARILEEITRTQAEARKLPAETQYMPRSMIFRAMIATAALLGAGATITKLFFS